MEIASRCLRTFTLSHHAAPRKLPPCLRARLWLWLCSTVCPTALVLASPYEGEDDDFVVICTNRAVLLLDVGLLSLHDLRADSLIRGQVSNSIVIESLPF